MSKMNKITKFILSFIVFFIIVGGFLIIKNDLLTNDFLFYKTNSDFYNVSYNVSEDNSNQIGVTINPMTKIDNVEYEIQVNYEDGTNVKKVFQTDYTLDPNNTTPDIEHKIFKNITQYILVDSSIKNVFMKISFTVGGENKVEKIKVNLVE